MEWWLCGVLSRPATTTRAPSALTDSAEADAPSLCDPMDMASRKVAGASSIWASEFSWASER